MYVMASHAAQVETKAEQVPALVQPSPPPESIPDAALQQNPWPGRSVLSSAADRCERFLVDQGFGRAPWLTIAFAAGIGAWFSLANRAQWLAFAAGLLALAAFVGGLTHAQGRWPFLRQALIAVPLLSVAGLAVIWTKSALVGVPPIDRAMVGRFDARVLYRDDQPPLDRVQLIVATRTADGRAIRARLNMPTKLDDRRIGEGARIVVRARLIPPAPPMLPGGYDFARTAWFAQLAATGSVLERPEVRQAAASDDWLRRVQIALSEHIRRQLPSPAGAIADAYASGEQGAIPREDQNALRDAGLSHLLSVSGLHVSAVIGATYLLAMSVLALFPWLALRVRLPLVAAAVAATAAIGYTLLTGSQVPTVRSCVGALLVLAALALGREALSLRMLAVGAFLVLLLWPDALAGPSFQLSFAAVLSIVALHDSAPMRRLVARREEGFASRVARAIAGLLITGAVVEVSLLPIGLFHFHRAGLYGTLANVVAIPLTELVTMPLLGLSLLLDLGGLGAPFWWLTGLSLDALLALAHFVSRQPGAVTFLPAMGRGAFALFVSGGLWLALWHGRVRLWGLIPVAVGTLSLASLRAPDILISGDGRHVGIPSEDGASLLVLRAAKAGFTSDTLRELAGMNGDLKLLSDGLGARCTPDFCAVTLDRGGRSWHLLISRGKDVVPERALAAACERVDIVIANRRLPASCRPALLKADRVMLDRNGGLTIDLTSRRISTVAQGEGEHGWWHPTVRTYRKWPVAGEAPGAAASGAAAFQKTNPHPNRPS